MSSVLESKQENLLFNYRYHLLVKFLAHFPAVLFFDEDVR